MTTSSFHASCLSLLIASLFSLGALAQDGETAKPENADAATAPSESAPAAPAPAEAKSDEDKAADTNAKEDAAPAEAAPAEAAPVEAAPAEAAPVEAAPAEAAPAEAAPAEAAPAEAAPAEAAPAEATPAEAAPAEAAPAEAAPAEAASAEAQQGKVSVSSTPVGDIYLDGEPLNLKTPAMDIPVSVGSHTLRVVDPETNVEKSVDFDVEAGVALQLELELEPVAAKPEQEVAKASKPEADWNWLTVAGWGSLGLGTMGLVSGAVVLTTPYDPDQETLGFGLFGAGAGMILGGGVMLYLDGEMADEQAAEAPTPDAESAPSALLPQSQPVALR